MFAGDRASIAHHEVGRLFHELAEFRYAFFRSQVEVDARMDAPMAEVAVKRAFVAVGGHHFAQIAKISAKFFGSHRRVFPAFPVQRLARDMRRNAESGFANFPHAFDLLFIRVEAHLGGDRTSAESLHQAPGLGFGFPRLFAPNSTISQPPPSGRRSRPSELIPFVRV